MVGSLGHIIHSNFADLYDGEGSISGTAEPAHMHQPTRSDASEHSDARDEAPFGLSVGGSALDTPSNDPDRDELE